MFVIYLRCLNRAAPGDIQYTDRVSGCILLLRQLAVKMDHWCMCIWCSTQSMDFSRRGTVYILYVWCNCDVLNRSCPWCNEGTEYISLCILLSQVCLSWKHDRCSGTASSHRSERLAKGTNVFEHYECLSRHATCQMPEYFLLASPSCTLCGAPAATDTSTDTLFACTSEYPGLI